MFVCVLQTWEFWKYLFQLIFIKIEQKASDAYILVFAALLNIFLFHFK